MENVKFCILLGESPSETLEMLKKAFGNNAIKKWVCRNDISICVKVTQTSKMTLRLDAPSSSTADENVEQIREIVHSDRPLMLLPLNLEFHIGVFTAFFLMI